MSAEGHQQLSVGPWRKLSYHVGRSDLHFALSDALVRLAHAPTLWWHSTRQPTLILGAAQAHFDSAACDRAGILVVRRQAGGTAVYAAVGVLGLDIVIPSGHELASPDVLEAYRWQGDVWVRGLQNLSIDVRQVSIEEARAASRTIGSETTISMACFGSLSPYEVIAGGRKLVGLAQVRRRAGVLLQSAIHLHFNPEGLAALLPSGGASFLANRLRHAAVGLDEVSPDPLTERTVIDAFERALSDTLGIELKPGEWTLEELHHAGRNELPASDVPSGDRIQ